MNEPPIRIGTRGSPLALVQAREVRARLLAAAPGTPEDAITLVEITTSGDRLLDRPLADAGGKGLFTKEIEEALLAGTIDLAVHSMKDVPTVLADGLEIACLLPREDTGDAFFSRDGLGLDEMPAGAVVGTSGLRRQAQVLWRRPDLRVVPLRGNVQTRLRKLAAGEVDATLLAVAGLNRLGQPAIPTEVLVPAVMLPAVGQGAIGIEVRSADARIHTRLAPLHCPLTSLRVTAERALLRMLDGSCRTPIAGHCTLTPDESLHLAGRLLSPDGRHMVEASACAAADTDSAQRLGEEVGGALRHQAPPGLLASLTAESGYGGWS